MEKELVIKLKKGNKHAQHTLYIKYSKMLFLLILRYINDENEAKSLTNHAFYKIFKNISQFNLNEKGNLIAWMKKIVINESLMHLRKHKKLKFTENEKELDSNSGQLADKNLMIEDYLKLIRELPDGYRLIFNMYVIEGYSHREIAEKLNIGESTSRSQLVHARAYLKKKIENYF